MFNTKSFRSLENKNCDNFVFYTGPEQKACLWKNKNGHLCNPWSQPLVNILQMRKKSWLGDAHCPSHENCAMWDFGCGVQMHSSAKCPQRWFCCESGLKRAVHILCWVISTSTFHVQMTLWQFCCQLSMRASIKLKSMLYMPGALQLCNLPKPGWSLRSKPIVANWFELKIIVEIILMSFGCRALISSWLKPARKIDDKTAIG